MRLFNSIQAVSMFAAGPFAISWLHSEGFAGHGVACVVAGVMYVMGAVAMVYCVYQVSGSGDGNRR